MFNFSEFQFVHLVPYPSVTKTLCVGRVIVLFSKHGNKAGLSLAVIVSSISKAKRKNICVFTMTEDTTDDSARTPIFTDVSELDKFVAVAENSIHSPESRLGHCLVDVSYDDVAKITSKVVKVDGEKVMTDIKKRQLPRFRFEVCVNIRIFDECPKIIPWVLFRDDPPGQSTISVIQELTAFIKDPANLKYLSFADAFGLKDMDLVLNSQKVDSMAEHISSNFQCTKCFSFQSHVRTPVFGCFTRSPGSVGPVGPLAVSTSLLPASMSLCKARSTIGVSLCLSLSSVFTHFSDGLSLQMVKSGKMRNQSKSPSLMQ